jgi:cysteine desulfurase
MHIDMLSMSAHKLYGPKGVGALFLKSGTRIDATIHGGGQEGGMRSGTENIPGIVGFGKAAELAGKEMKQESKRLAALRDRLIKNVLKIENSWLNGHPVKRSPNNAHFCFRYIEGEALVISLSDLGIAASTGSACSSKSLEPSHVLLALGMKHEEAHGSLRLTLGKYTKKQDIDYVSNALPGVISRLREISPFKRRW